MQFFLTPLDIYMSCENLSLELERCRKEIERCREELAVKRSRIGIPEMDQWIVYLGLNDWATEEILIEEEIKRLEETRNV